MEALAGNCIGQIFGGRVSTDWSGSLSLEALISAPAGRLHLEDGEWPAQGDDSAGRLGLLKQGSVVLTCQGEEAEDELKGNRSFGGRTTPSF